MTFALSWMPQALEVKGLKVAPTVGWLTRGRAEMGQVRGVMCHHTATVQGGNMPSLDLLINGRRDLPGPLCHLGLGRDGTYYVVAAGRANHAGRGRWEGVTFGNASFVGIEAEHSGRAADPWPEVQLEAYHRGVAAILEHIKAGANMCCGHKEFAEPRGRKCDPTFDMAQFRSEVARILVGKSPPPPIPARDERRRPTLRRGMRGEAVRDLQGRLGIDDDGIFGVATEARLRVWQRARALVPDGIAGPMTWQSFDVEPPPSAAPVAPTLAPARAAGTAIEHIDEELLKVAFPGNTATELKRWIDPFRDACHQFGIGSRHDIAGFLANIAVESGDLNTMTESLNYSVEGLMKTFGHSRISEADCRRIGRKRTERRLPQERQRELANLLYGGDWGRRNLGNTEHDDGWTFRGYGPIQLTGRDNVTRFAQAIQIPVEQAPAFIRTPQGGALSAAWFWRTRVMDRRRGPARLSDDRKAVNPKQLGLDIAQRRFARLTQMLAGRGL